MSCSAAQGVRYRFIRLCMATPPWSPALLMAPGHRFLLFSFGPLATHECLDEFPDVGLPDFYHNCGRMCAAPPIAELPGQRSGVCSQLGRQCPTSFVRIRYLPLNFQSRGPVTARLRHCRRYMIAYISARLRHCRRYMMSRECYGD